MIYAVTYSPKARPESIIRGKLYEVLEEVGEYLFVTRSETGNIISCCWDDCAHLGGDSWGRIETGCKPRARQATLAGAKLWQDAEGALPCREGDPVGRVDCDQTGNSWTSSGDGRPVYQEHSEPPAWDGESWPPPEGERVEVRLRDRPELLTGTVMAVGRDRSRMRIAVKTDCGMLPTYNRANGANGWMVRPIRSEEERDIDGMVESIVSHYENPKGAEQYKGLARALYRAGYRKVTND